MVQTNNESGITRTLGGFAQQLEYEDLSPEVIDWAKYLCLDFAAVTLNGSTTGSARAAVDALQRLERPGPSAIVGTPHRVLPEYASMANGIAFHSIEMDDVNNEASLHPGVVAFPTALSMADLAHVSGKDFIAAVVAGYDVIVRLGRALQPAEHYGRGFHPTGTCGAIRRQRWWPDGCWGCKATTSSTHWASRAARRRVAWNTWPREPGPSASTQAGRHTAAPGRHCWRAPATRARRPSSRAATDSFRPIRATPIIRWCYKTLETSI